MTNKIELDFNTTYYTKDGAGNIITVKGATETYTPDVWAFGYLCRHISDVAPTLQSAEYIKYPNRH